MESDIEVCDTVTTRPPHAPRTPADHQTTFPLSPGYTLPFYAPFCYSPHGGSAIARRSRRLRDLVKRADSATILRGAKIIAALREVGRAPDFLGPGCAIIPVPRRQLRHPGDPYTAPEAISLALRAAGLADLIWPALRRRYPVPKSAWCRPGSRPEFLDHYASLELTDRDLPALTLVLVDDFITLGRTLLAAAAVLHNALPAARVRGFAFVRTEGLRPDIRALTDPIAGVIRYSGGDAFRSP